MAIPAQIPASNRIGDLLLGAGAVSEETLERALDEQRRHGARIGETLVNQGAISGLALAKAVAAHHALPFLDLLANPPDAARMEEAQLSEYIAHCAVPWRKENGATILAATDISAAFLDWALSVYGVGYRLAIVSRRDVQHAIQQRFGPVLDEESREALYRLAPGRSAKFVLPPRQRHMLGVIFALLALSAVFFTVPTIVAIVSAMNLFYCLTIALKALLLYGWRFYRPAKTLPVAENALPIYTILVPLYCEAESLKRLLPSLRALDYPRAKLDIKLIVEMDDHETFDAIKALLPEGMFDIVRVPYSLPRTKPKACNYALRFARGEFVTIYDAEDAPEPNQLRAAVAQFRAGPPDLVCLQARLNYYNATRNLLTRLFAIEYSSWFDFMLPGLERLKIPIPLGGTSNHLSLKKLRELGQWDPYNVTEDADLGLRLSVSRYRTAILDSLTMEEAPANLWGWVRQRSRWIKGYLQTYLVHMRDPMALFETVGPRGFWGFQFFVGGPCLVFLTAPLLWAIWLLWIGGLLTLPASALPWWLGLVVSFNLLLGITVHATMAIFAIRRWRWPGVLPALFCYPFYWLLHSVAAYRALWQLMTRPHYWEKTDHCVP